MSISTSMKESIAHNFCALGACKTIFFWVGIRLLCTKQCFMAPPQIWGEGAGGELTGPPPPEKFLRGEPPPPPKGRCFDFLRGGGGKRAIFAPKWPNFPARGKGARGIPQSAYNSLQIDSNLRKNGSKTQKLPQECPWWRKSVQKR